MRSRHANRRGLTLVELLVVITIVVALFAILAAIAPHFSERQRATRGASQLQGWILIAKQRALRDNAPRGIRLPVVTNAPPYAQYVTQLQYIEQPDPYQPATIDNTGTTAVVADLKIASFPNYNQVIIGWAPGAVPNIGAALNQALDALWPDRTLPPDVVLDFYGRYPGQPRRVVGISQPTTSAGITGIVLTLDNVMEPAADPAKSQPPPPSKDYRFYRAAQPIAGEPVLQLPRGIAIDISREPTAKSNLPSWYRLYPPSANALQAQPLDILFDQTGQVIGANGRASNRICLWVRDVSNNIFPNSFNDPNATDPTLLPPGDNSIITIYTRSGLIAAHPVDETGLKVKNWNPFRFTQDGRSSGM